LPGIWRRPLSAEECAPHPVFNEITRTAVQQASRPSARPWIWTLSTRRQGPGASSIASSANKLSPVLSKKIQKGLSAGRGPVRGCCAMICDREAGDPGVRAAGVLVRSRPRSRPAKPEEAPSVSRQKLFARGAKRLEPKSAEEIEIILADLKDCPLRRPGRQEAGAETERRPRALYHEHASAGGGPLSSDLENRRTMSVAQAASMKAWRSAAEGSVGLITYMRTDLRTLLAAEGADRGAPVHPRKVRPRRSTPAQETTSTPTLPRSRSSSRRKGQRTGRPRGPFGRLPFFGEPDKIAHYLSAETAQAVPPDLAAVLSPAR